MTKVSTSSPKRPRLRALRQDCAPAGSPEVPREHMRLFAQLFAGCDDGAGGGASLAGRKASANVSMIQALTEQLAPRVLGASQWPLVAVLYLPRLGRINANVRREQGAWNIELAAQEESTAQWLGSVRLRLQDGLEHSMGSPVSLSLTGVGRA